MLGKAPFAALGGGKGGNPLRKKKVSMPNTHRRKVIFKKIMVRQRPFNPPGRGTKGEIEKKMESSPPTARKGRTAVKGGSLLDPRRRSKPRAREGKISLPDKKTALPSLRLRKDCHRITFNQKRKKCPPN